MLPEKLSTDLTSLNFESDRLAIVIEMVLDADGSLQRSDLYRATVRNRAKLTYNGVAAWLQDHGPMPPAIATASGLEENLRIQDRMAQKLKGLRHLHGALNLETIQAHPVFDQDELKDLETETTNRAKDIIEDFMIAANGVTVRYLTPTVSRHSAGSCAHLNGGSGLWTLLHCLVNHSRRNPIPVLWKRFFSSGNKSTR
jgi:exoribonuclease-2